MERCERLLVEGDLVGQRLVLLADVDVVAHLGQQVGERAARQERLEERGPVGVVCAPHALGEHRLAVRELATLGLLAGSDHHERRVETPHLGDEAGVIGLDHVDLVLHHVDLVLDRGQVDVDALELDGRVLDRVG